MALTRKFLAALGIEAEKIDEIVNAHSETVEALKEERDSFKDKAEKYDKAQKDLEVANKTIEDLNKEDAYKVKYEALKEDFDKYKKDTEAAKTKATKTDGFRSILKEIGISDKRIESVIKVSGSTIDNLKYDKEGKIEGLEDLKKSLAEEWSDFIVKDAGAQGADVNSHPANNGGAVKTKEEIMKIKDTSERQKAWADLIRQGGV